MRNFDLDVAFGLCSIHRTHAKFVLVFDIAGLGLILTLPDPPLGSRGICG